MLTDRGISKGDSLLYLKQLETVGGAIEVEYIVKYNGGIDCPFI
jgi:hypothetical protein